MMKAIVTRTAARVVEGVIAEAQEAKVGMCEHREEVGVRERARQWFKAWRANPDWPAAAWGIPRKKERLALEGPRGDADVVEEPTVDQDRRVGRIDCETEEILVTEGEVGLKAGTDQRPGILRSPGEGKGEKKKEKKKQLGDSHKARLLKNETLGSAGVALRVLPDCLSRPSRRAENGVKAN